METKFTPGPWRVEIGDIESDWAHQWPTIQAENYEVVGTEGIYGDMETDLANARLIAAAPELLEALQVMLRDYTAIHDIGDVEMQPAIYQAKAAITKATGVQA